MPITAPTDISGCQLWLDADDDASITFGTGFAVSQWNDKSGNSRHVSQATAANQPVRVLMLAGRQSLQFTAASSMYMKTAAASTVNQPYTIFLVASRSGTSSSDSGAVAGFTTLNAQLRHGANAANATTYAGNAFVNEGSFPDLNEPTVISAVYNGASSQIWVNGASAGTGNPGSNAIDLVTIGALGTTANPLQGNIGEVIVYNTALTTTQRQDVEAYLNGRWLTADPATAEVVDTATFTSSGSISSTPVPIPAHLEDDIVFITLCTNDTGNTINIPAGFTAVGAEVTNANITSRSMWARVPSDNFFGATVVVTHSTFRRTSSTTMIIRGGSTTVDPYGAGAQFVTSSPSTSPNLTITGDDTLLVAGFSFRTTMTFPIVDPDWSEDDFVDGGGSNTGARCAHRTSRVNAGSYVGETLWDPSAFSGHTVWTLAVESEAVGGGIDYPETAATTVTGTTTVAETAQRSDIVATTGTVTTTVAAVAARADIVATSGNVTTTIVDALAHAEGLATTIASTTGLADALAHAEMLATVVAGTTGLADAVAMLEALATIINGTTGVSDSLSGAASYNESADITGTVTTGLADLLASNELLTIVISATTDEIDSWAGFEALATAVVGTTGLVDHGAVQEQCSLVFVTTTGCIDSLTVSETLLLAILGTTGLSDIYISGTLTPFVILVAAPVTAWQTDVLRDGWHPAKVLDSLSEG